MKRSFTLLLGALLLSVALVVTVWAQEETQVPPPATPDAEWLAVIGELNGGIASYTATSPECRYNNEHELYICPEPLPAVLPVPDPAERALALKQLGETGLLLVTDTSNRRVIALDPLTGTVLDPNFIPSDPDHLEIPIAAFAGPNGDTVLVSSYGDDLVQEYDLNGNWLGSFAPAGGANSAVLDTPRGMAWRPNGNLLVTNVRNPSIDSVAEFNSSGSPLGDFITNGSSPLESPYDILAYGSDWLVSGATSGGVYRFDSEGDYVGLFGVVDSFPQQIQLAANGNILVANFAGNQKGILELGPAGNEVHNYNPMDNGQRGIYELPNGNYLTASGTGASGGGYIYEVDRDTGSVVNVKLSGEITPRYIEFIGTGVSISLKKTVGTSHAFCATGTEIDVPAGSTVYYCYTVTNTGAINLNTHDLVDDQLGVILNDFVYNLVPGASAFLTQSTTLTETTVNTATWTASNGGISASDSATATVNIVTPTISVKKTVGLDPGVCATETNITIPATTTVTYCYMVTNTGPLTLTHHTLEDSELGMLLNDFLFTLIPGASAYLTHTAIITETTTNVATWTASITEPVEAEATAMASATVYVGYRVYLPVLLKN